MDECGTAWQGVSAAARHFLRRNQQRFFGLPRLVDRGAFGIDIQSDPPCQPVCLQGMHTGHLVRRPADAQTIGQPVRQPV
jgi:hypothetical protein